MATNRLEDARRKLIEEDEEVYNYIAHFITARNYDTAGDAASNAGNLELANKFWSICGNHQQAIEVQLANLSERAEHDASNVS